MRGSQIIIVRGRVTQDPDLKTSESGSPYMKVGLAVNEKVKNNKGKVEEKVTFYNLLCFSKMAEIFSKLKKGDFVRAEGKFEVDTYLSKNKEPKADLTIFAEDIIKSDYISD